MPRLLALACLAGLLAAPVGAQSLPGWAAPAPPVQADGGGFASLVPCPPGQTPTGPGGSCIGPPPPPVPLDGGLGLLALAGGALAARRLRRRDA